MYKIILTKQAQKDQRNIEAAGLKEQAKKLIAVLKENPYQTPPPYEKLVGNLQGFYSRRINIQHRIVYQILENADGITDPNGDVYEGYVKIVRMWTHYNSVR